MNSSIGLSDSYSNDTTQRDEPQPIRVKQQFYPPQREVDSQQVQQRQTQKQPQKHIGQKLSKKEKARLRKLEANVKIDSIPSKISGDKGGNGNGNIKSNGKAKNKGGPQYETELESLKRAYQVSEAKSEERRKQLEVVCTKLFELNRLQEGTSNDTRSSSIPVASTSNLRAEVPVGENQTNESQVINHISSATPGEKYEWNEDKIKELNTLLVQISKDPQFGQLSICWQAITNTLNETVEGEFKIEVEDVIHRSSGLMNILEDLDNIKSALYELMIPK